MHGGDAMARRDAIEKRETTEKRKCFVVGPFGKPDSEARAWSNFLMDNVIKFAIGDEYDVCRTIDAPESGDIVDRIKRDLEHADMVIGDITDHNSNVFYELGFRAARGLPFVLVRRVCSQSSSQDDVPFILSTFEAIGIEAEYDSARGRYMLGEAARTISDVRAQVAKEAQKQHPPELLNDGAYRVRMFKWRTQYSRTIATDWLEQQGTNVKRLINEYEKGTRPRVSGDRLAALAEYIELKTAANQTMDGTAVYFVNTHTKEIDLGFAIYNFPNQVVVINLGGREDRENGTAELTFDQRSRQVAVGDLRTELPSYSFAVRFTRTSKPTVTGTTTLTGVIVHPRTATKVGEAELVTKWGFKF